ncbi:MAG: type IV pilus modification protein PilV [Kangiellaceae bacterium]|jgi:type IV pilus modification protein PilV|nr:type IV pilus modification protein PilV [Kangiellaceae bacterium]
MKHSSLIQKQAGISLIEILVTALILGVGLLGVAAMQVTSINSNQEGYFRSQATDIAENVANRMRTARLATYDGNTTLLDVINAYQGAPYACDAAPASCMAANCNAAQLIAYDRWETCDLAQTELPEGEIYVQNVSGIRTRVAVAWTPIAARADLGQNQILNVQCQTVGVPNNKDCVILEVIP